MTDDKEKNGLAVGFLTDGVLNVKWVMRLFDELKIPPGVFHRKIWVEGKGYKEKKEGYGKARQNIVDRALELNFKWLFFVDSDVFPPEDAISRLMAHEKPIVSGIYYMKTQPPQPVIFKETGGGPYFNYPVNELVPIAGAGLGCCLIDLDVFRKFKESGIPFFKENWSFKKDNGINVHCPIGEDHWFFKKAIELGYQPYCDTSVICDHAEYKHTPATGPATIFPGEEEIQKIRKKILLKEGHGDIIEKETELYNVEDNGKKTIVFSNLTIAEFDGNEIEKRPLGGAETCVINIAKRLAKNYNVYVFGNVKHQGVYDGVKYLNIQDADFMKKLNTDLLVVLRNTRFVAEFDPKSQYRIKKLAMWFHDRPAVSNHDYYMEAEKRSDYTIVLSEWHKKALLERFPEANPDRIVILRNGVDTDLFHPWTSAEKPTATRDIIYSSTPFRGLDILLKAFPKIKEKVPDAKLHVCSSLKVYGEFEGKKDIEYEHLYKLARETDGVEYHGSVKQKELAEIMRKCKALTYPSTFEETSCITAMEAMASGIPVVTTALAALPETVPADAGIFLKHPIDENEFVEAVVKILQHPELATELGAEGANQNNSWDLRAQQWVQQFFNGDKLETTPIVKEEMDKELMKEMSEEPKTREVTLEKRTEPSKIDYLISQVALLAGQMSSVQKRLEGIEKK